MLKGLAGLEDAAPAEPMDKLQAANYVGKRILLVEDNDLNREIARELLSMTGAVVDTAFDGQDAVEQFAASRVNYYDLIIMDIQMPMMNGYEAAAFIRKLDREDAGNVPIFAMTANAFAEDVALTRRAGMNEHIAKPIDIDALMKAMGRWMN